MASLADRAYRLLRELGGTAEQDQLSRLLFGGSGPAWERMLASALDDPRFAREDSVWRLIGEEVATGRFAFAIETTGQNPARHKIVSLSACAVQPDGKGAAFFSYVNPERRLPRWLAERLGVDPALGDDAPSLAHAIERFMDFVGEGVLVGYDAGWQFGFLQAQLRFNGLPALTSEVHDLLPMAAARLGTGKPKLETIAARMGIPVGRRWRESGEARLVATIAARLDQEPALATSFIGEDALTDAIRRAPDAPGVYIFRNESGEALYIGKAKQLRRRLQQYAGRPSRHERGLTGLRTETAQIDLLPAADDLEATLNEAALLSALAPRFNTQRRVSPSRHYLSFAADEPFPRLRATVEPVSRAFGPFASGAAAARESRLVNEIFALRTCARKLGLVRKRKPKPPCPLLELGRCLGPCTGTLLATEYQSLVNRASAFLAGNREVGLQVLRERAASAAAHGDQAEAGRLRALLKRLSGEWAGNLLEPPFDPANVAILLPFGNPRRLYLIQRGCLRLAVGLDSLTETALAGAASGEPTGDERRAGLVVMRWLTSNRRHARLVPLTGSVADTVARIRQEVNLQD